ncbi:MAG: hypothetical protein ACK5HT_11260 [Draconibacterium sp.]
MKNLITTITLILSFFFYSVNVNSQALKVKQDGTVLINGTTYGSGGENYAGEVAAIVYGDYGEFLANGRLALGDYGKMSNHGGNIFIGELRN